MPWRRSLGQRREEALVLGAGSVGDADVAGAAERRARLGLHAGSGQRVDDLGLVAVAEIDPGEVRLRVRRSQAELAEPLLDEDPLDQVLLHPVDDVVLVEDRLGGRRLSEEVDAERLADGVDGGAELRASRARTRPGGRRGRSTC